MSATQTLSVYEDTTLNAGLVLRCPRCCNPLEGGRRSSGLACTGCSFQLCEREGIGLALPPERQEYYAKFIAEYERIRAAEGRGCQTSDYYLALPYQDLSGRNRAQWKIRGRTFSYLDNRILPAIQSEAGRDARVLDVGSGNGWLSYRLALMGFRPVAVDLLVNDQDGLGAAQHYQDHLDTMFPRFQAESAHLPFASAQFDAVIFNASFHYAESYTVTLLEALRCLKTGGMIVVADSPWYSKKSSGEQMLVERRSSFLARFGTLSNSIPSQEFLTEESLKDLEFRLGLRWRFHTPFYGLRWIMRPWSARLHRRREPARFRIYTVRKTS
jgi:SAM-dependent methyltransferase